MAAQTIGSLREAEAQEAPWPRIRGFLAGAKGDNSIQFEAEDAWVSTQDHTWNTSMSKHT